MKYTLQSNMPILEALALLAPEGSKTSFRSWIKEGRVSVDGELISNVQERLCQGQSISVGSRPKYMEGGIRVLYEDKHIVVVDKPEGLLSVSTNFEKGETVHSFLKGRYRPKKVYVVHRLDQDTSGVMVYALSEVAMEELKKIFEKHDIERKYTAVVEGRMKTSKGVWQSRLFEDESYKVHATDDPDKGRNAITHYEVKDSKRTYSLLELTLETGRKNQIRVHCQAAGHCIVGDKKYGATKNPLKRICLHAHLLAFHHPITKKLMRFVSPVPESFKKIFRPPPVKENTQ